jgi:hypothetical protein
MSASFPTPKKTFLDSRRPQSDAPAAIHPQTPRSTEAVILGEHKVELTDMVLEAVSLLKNVYRSKFLFGEHLKFVDPSFSGDTVNKFNLATPPSFDPSYAHQVVSGNRDDSPQAPQVASAAPPQSGGPGLSSATPGSNDTQMRDKLRTAEELIKKIFRRNTQLEVDNKHLKAEISKYERLAGLSRTPAHTLTCHDGHLPADNPLYTKKYKRRCRSGPPCRTLLRSAVDGWGLTFPKRGGGEEAAPPKEDPVPVQHLKKRVLQLTEALVTVQHENEKLSREKIDRVSFRDQLLQRYIAERDSQIAQLHTSLQELVQKIQNPLRLARARQPSATMNPVVATNNVLKEVSQRLTDSITGVADDIVKKTVSALPPSSSSVAAAGAEESSGNAAPGGGSQLGHRRKELTNRLRSIVETLPVNKRKQLLLLMSELRELFDALVLSNRSLLTTYEDHRRQSDKDAIFLKLQVAQLRDRLRSLGGSVDEEEVVRGATQGPGDHRDP